MFPMSASVALFFFYALAPRYRNDQFVEHAASFVAVLHETQLDGGSTDNLDNFDLAADWCQTKYCAHLGL